MPNPRFRPVLPPPRPVSFGPLVPIVIGSWLIIAAVVAVILWAAGSLHCIRCAASAGDPAPPPPARLAP